MAILKLILCYISSVINISFCSLIIFKQIFLRIYTFVICISNNIMLLLLKTEFLKILCFLVGNY